MKTILRDWLHSVEGAFSGGHFHWTPGLIAALAVLAVVAFASLRMRRLGAAEPASSGGSGGVVVIGLTALALGVAVLLDRHAPAAVKAAAKPHPAATRIITRTITHTVTKAAPHFQVTGTEIVIMICVFIVAGVAKKAMTRR